MPTKRSILIVDPDAFLAGIYARRFELGHWRVRVAEGADEARKAMARKVSDAVLVDVETVPEGLILLKEWHKDPKTAETTLVVLTKLGDRASIAKALAAGADAYLLKGHFVPSEVRLKVERLVAGEEEE